MHVCDIYVVFFVGEKILFLKPEQEKDKTYFVDKNVSMINLC